LYIFSNLSLKNYEPNKKRIVNLLTKSNLFYTFTFTTLNIYFLNTILIV